MLLRSPFRTRPLSGRISWALSAAAFCVALGGCATSTDRPLYNEPMSNIRTISLIRGEKSLGGADASSNNYSYLLGVDGSPIRHTGCGYDKPTRVVGGPHSLEVGFINGLSYARTKLFVEVPPNEDLFIRHRLDNMAEHSVESSFGEPSDIYETVTLWLESQQTGARYAQTRPMKLFTHPDASSPGLIRVLTSNCP